MKFITSIAIDQKPEVIWDFLMLITEDIHWREGIVKAEWTSEPPYGVGSTGVHYHEKMGAYEWEVTRFEDGHSFEFIHRKSPLSGSTALFEIESEDQGSVVRMKANLTGPPIMRFMMLFMTRMMRKGLEGDLIKLKELMENKDSC